MAAAEEFFSQLRSFASTLDKDCSELKSKLEDDEISTDDEGRWHLVLRGILSEAMQLKREAASKSSEMNQMFSFSEFLKNSERLAEHTKTQIEAVQEHLMKYGYKSLGQLPSVAVNNNDNKESVSMDTDGSDGTLDNSQSKDDVDAMETDAKSSDEGCKEKGKDEDEDDFMSTPVKPVTYTPMIQATPPPLPNQGRLPKDTQSTPEQSPVPPKTTTPMIKVKQLPQNLEHKSLHSPSSHDTPPQPMTFTPLIKPAKHAGLQQGMASSQPDDDSPLPPVLYTPGIRLMSVPGLQGPADLPSDFGTPTPPKLITTTLLKPEDLEIEGPRTSGSLADSAEYPTLHPVVEDEYVTLPGYVKTQFSIDDINEVLLSIEEFLKLQTEETSRKTLKEDVLREAFCLGRKTKAFMLALKKLGRAEVTNGILIFTT